MALVQPLIAISLERKLNTPARTVGAGMAWLYAAHAELSVRSHRNKMAFTNKPSNQMCRNYLLD